MTVGVVGANGQVGPELCALLRERGHTVVPIVRNKFGGALFGHHGFEYRVADVSDPDHADVLSDIDTVVVAARAGTSYGATYRSAYRTNRSLLRHAVTYSPDDAAVVYFSSIAAFGPSVYGPTGRSRFDNYRVEKLLGERTLRSVGSSWDVRWYSLRLGHVFGPRQGRTREFDDRLDGDRCIVRADPDRPSNVVHTTVLADAIETCAAGSVDSGRYTVVNRPQWTWGDVCDYYATPGTTVTYRTEEQSDELSVLARLSGAVAGMATGFVRGHRSALIPLLRFVPESLNQRLIYGYHRNKAASTIADYETRRCDAVTYYRDEFVYRKAPGPYLGSEATADGVDAAVRTVERTFAHDS